MQIFAAAGREIVIGHIFDHAMSFLAHGMNPGLTRTLYRERLSRKRQNLAWGDPLDTPVDIAKIEKGSKTRGTVVLMN
jgi:hypothetical protein